MKKVLYLLIVSLIIVACNDDDDNGTPEYYQPVDLKGNAYSRTIETENGTLLFDILKFTSDKEAEFLQREGDRINGQITFGPEEYTVYIYDHPTIQLLNKVTKTPMPAVFSPTNTDSLYIGAKEAWFVKFN